MKTLDFTVRVYRAPRKLVRRLEAAGRLPDVLEDAARLLAWHGAARVTVVNETAPAPLEDGSADGPARGTRWTLKRAALAPASPPDALIALDAPDTPSAVPNALQGALMSERSERS